GEQQGQVGLDAGLFQALGGADAFPGGGDLDQYPVSADAGFLVQTDQPLGALPGGLAVEGQAGVHFGGDPSRDHLENLATHGDGELVAGQADIPLGGLAGPFQQFGIAGQGGSLEQQRRIGGGVHGLQTGDGIQVAGVSDYSSEGFQLVQLGRHEAPAMA